MHSGFRVVVCMMLSACSTPAPAVAAPDAGPSIEASITTDVDATTPPCSAPADQRAPGSTCVLEAKGSVQDLSGAPLSNVITTLCGSICYGTQSNDGGTFSVTVGDFLDTENYAIHADGRPNHAVDYFRLTQGEPQVITVSMRLPTFPASHVSLPADGASASSVTQGDVTLNIADGTKFDLDIEDFGTPDGRIFRVANVPMASAPSHATLAKVDAIYALAPSGAVASSKMGITLTNSAGLASSAAVDLLVLGDDYFSTPPNVGVLSVAAAAHVSADGKTIQTDPGEGITKITWLGVRLKGK